MSLFFYRGPGSNGRTKEPLAVSRYTSWWKCPEALRRKIKIPPRLSFEEIVRDNTSSPCSLDEFMNYLIYVERSAENLQFFLWYSSYVEKWSQVPEWERQRSPTWNTRKSVNPQAQTWSMRVGEKTDRLNRVLTILDQDPTKSAGQTASARTEPRAGLVETNFSRPRTPTPAFVLGTEGQDGDKWQWEPFGAQPFRDEVTEIVRHYISITGPRKLNLTYQDRAACMHALQHTTHPSAFLPVFLAAETALRGHSHPNFIRWSIRNINRPRILFARAIGALLIAIAVVLDIILILSNFHRLTRISALPFWYVGLYILLIEGRGISSTLYMNRKRHLRPWEEALAADLESTQPEVRNEQAESRSPTDSSEHKTQDIATQVDRPKKESFQPLGPANDFENQPWVRSYQEKPFWRKVFGVHVVNHNRHIRALQDRVVFTALLLAGFLVVVLTLGSVLIPSGNFF